MADIIVASLLVDSTPVPRKVARLHLICDILQNSAAPGVPSAWKFRIEFQGRLGVVFDHLANIYHSFPGRITADLFKKQITTVIDLWENWCVFPNDFTAELRARLEGNVITDEEKPQATEAPATDEIQPLPSKFKPTGFQPATKPVEPVPTEDDGEPMDVSSDDDDNGSDLDGKPTDDVDGAPVEDVDGVPVDDLDGIPVDEVDGEPVDIDGEPLDDMDGEPMADDDVDGQPVDDDDLDGVPM